MSGPKLILASGSPRRLVLLGRLEVPFDVIVSEADETPEPGLEPAVQAMNLAQRKARAVAEGFGDGLVLGADTIVVLDGQLLGKPGDDREAASFLRRLSGRTHEVITGLALIDVATRTCRRRSVSTTVRMQASGEQEIVAYVATGEPRDKAGAYAIQGHGAALVAGIEGCYTNVVGLPLCEVTALLEEAGLQVSRKSSVCRGIDGRACPRLV